MAKFENIKNPKLREFYERGAEFIAKGKASSGGDAPCVAIRPGTPEWAKWSLYFDWLGAKPIAMRMVEQKQMESMTVPAQWPEWFDNVFATRAAA